MKKGIYILQCPPSWLKTPPLALVYLENYLRANGFKVTVRDINAELFKSTEIRQNDWLALNKDFEESLFGSIKGSADFLETLYKEIESYEYVGFSVLRRNSSFSFKLAEKIREKFSSKKIIFGGPQTFFLNYKEKLDDNAFWVTGEGESALLKILNGCSQKVLRFEELEDLDSLPFLDFDCLGFNNYSNSIPILSSRGCKFGCNFCSERKLYKKFRQHSPKYTSDLIKYLTQKYGTNAFVFCDSLINYSNEWLEKFCLNLIQDNNNIKWEAQMRVDKQFSEKLGLLMKESGCYNLFVGFESASAATLKNMNKGFDPEIAESFFRKLKNSGLHFEISLIFDYPGETDEDFRETLDFIVRNKHNIPKIAQANPFTDYMGSFPDKTFPRAKAMEKIKLFLSTIEKEKIKYTKSFINNLVY